MARLVTPISTEERKFIWTLVPTAVIGALPLLRAWLFSFFEGGFARFVRARVPRAFFGVRFAASCAPKNRVSRLVGAAPSCLAAYLFRPPPRLMNDKF